MMKPENFTLVLQSFHENVCTLHSDYLVDHLWHTHLFYCICFHIDHNYLFQDHLGQPIDQHTSETLLVHSHLCSILGWTS